MTSFLPREQAIPLLPDRGTGMPLGTLAAKSLGTRNDAGRNHCADQPETSVLHFGASFFVINMVRSGALILI
jgi:hypothetical protein